MSNKASRDAARIDPNLVVEAEKKLRKELGVWDIHDIANTGEVGVHYLSFPSRYLNPSDGSTGAQNNRDRITAVITIF